MSSIYDFMSSCAVFAVFGYASQVAATMWFGSRSTDSGSLSRNLSAMDSFAWANIFKEFCIWGLRVTLLVVSAIYIFMNRVDVGVQAERMRFLYFFYVVGLANLLFITGTKMAALSDRTYGEGATVFKTPFAGFKDVLDTSNKFKGDDNTAQTKKITVSYIETGLVYLYLFGLCAFNTVIQGKFYASSNGRGDVIFTDYWVFCCGFVGLFLSIFFFNIGHNHDRDTFVCVKRQNGMLSYNVALPTWVQCLMTIVTLGTFTVFFGDYIRVFFAHVLFLFIVWGQTGWKRDQGTWFEAHSIACVTICETVFFPVLFLSASWSTDHSQNDMLAAGHVLDIMKDWENVAANFSFPMVGLYKVDLGVIALGLVIWGIIAGLTDPVATSFLRRTWGTSLGMKAKVVAY